jgi:uncharacterized protein YkwD
MRYPLTVMSRALVALTLALGGLIAVSSAAPAQAAVTQTYLNGYEVQVVNAINYQRARYGLRALSYTSCPDGYAERWAVRLRTSSTLYHQSMYTVMSGCSATMAAENLARAATPASSLVALWMRSSTHRANILSRSATQVGVATQCASLCTTVADFIRR